MTYPPKSVPQTSVRRGAARVARPLAHAKALSLTPEGYDRARRLLMRRDPVLGAAIKRIGSCGMAERQRKDHLTALIGAIVSQQLSTKAAATIFNRFAALFPDGEISGAAGIDALTNEALRGVG